MRNRGGMSPRVSRALEHAADLAVAPKSEIAGCPKCGQHMYFDTDPIGRMVEACTGAKGCGYRKRYAGGLTVTKERRLEESGATKNGEIAKDGRGKNGKGPRGTNGRFGGNTI